MGLGGEKTRTQQPVRKSLGRSIFFPVRSNGLGPPLTALASAHGLKLNPRMARPIPLRTLRRWPRRCTWPIRARLRHRLSLVSAPLPCPAWAGWSAHRQDRLWRRRVDAVGVRRQARLGRDRAVGGDFFGVLSRGGYLAYASNGGSKQGRGIPPMRRAGMFPRETAYRVRPVPHARARPRRTRFGRPPKRAEEDSGPRTGGHLPRRSKWHGAGCGSRGRGAFSERRLCCTPRTGGVARLVRGVPATYIYSGTLPVLPRHRLWAAVSPTLQHSHDSCRRWCSTHGSPSGE